MDFFNSAQKLSWPTQVLTDAYNNQKIDFAPILANQQAASNFHNITQNIVGGAPFPAIAPFGNQAAALGDRRAATTSATPLMAKAGKGKGASSSSAAAMGKVVNNKQPKQNRRKWSPNRKAAGFWGPFNDWWRLEFTRLGRRPTTEEVSDWYVQCADQTWPGQKPSLKETRRHAKCLRTTEDVRNYFRKYRAKGRNTQNNKQPEQTASAVARKNPLADKKVSFSQGMLQESRGLTPAAWIQSGGNGFFNSGNIGAFTSQNNMFSAMYQNYQAHQAAQVQAQAQAQAQAQVQVAQAQGLNRLMQNTNIMYNIKFAQDAQQNNARKKKEAIAITSESPSSAETTEVVERTHHLEAHTENACLSSMIGIIERSRSLTNTPTPIPWRHEEVSTAFQDDNHLENIKLDYAPHTHSIHILPAAVVDSAESNGEHYIDGL